MSDDVRSTFLFATADWKEGVGRLVDFANALSQFNRTTSREDPDVRALTQDWLAVGDRIRHALASFARDRT